LSEFLVYPVSNGWHCYFTFFYRCNDKPYRLLIAFFLVVIYSLALTSPLARAFNAPHAMAAESTSNYETCGCSAERQANHTCCCWMKNLKHKGNNVVGCCKKKMRHRMTMLSSCPCGDNRMPGLSGFEKTEQLPYHFNNDYLAFYEGILEFSHVDLLNSIPGLPPEPPPKLSCTV